MIANAVVMPLAGWLARTLGARALFIWCLDEIGAHGKP